MRSARRTTEYVEDNQEYDAQSFRGVGREHRRYAGCQIRRVLGQTARGQLYKNKDRRRGI